MAPEQARREPVDRRSDVYALCVILHEFLTLRHYLEDIEDVPAMLDAVIHRPVPLASTVRHPHQEPIPMDLSWIIERGVRKDPSERFASVDELLERLSDRSEGRIHVQCPVTFTKRATNEVERAMDRWIVPRMGFLLSAGRVGVLVAAGLMMMLIGAMLVVGVAGVAGATLLLAGAVG
jgi:serine/threonine-protein kinase